MNRKFAGILAAIVWLSALCSATLSAQTEDDEQLLRVRESVWRAFFADDIRTLAALLPTDTIALGPGQDGWENRADVFRDAADFHAKGGKLIRLEFPRTEIRRYGGVALTYSQFLYEIELNGKRSVTTGRAMEVFVLRNGRWLNPGWHTDREP